MHSLLLRLNMQLVLILKSHVLHALLLFLLDKKPHLELLALILETLVQRIRPILPLLINKPISSISCSFDRE